MDSTVPAVKEELEEVIQPLAQDCIQGRLAEHIVDFAVPPINEEASASGAHRGADKGIPRAADQGENRGGAACPDSGTHPRARRRPELPKKCHRRKRQKRVNLAVTLRTSCLKRRWRGREKGG